MRKFLVVSLLSSVALLSGCKKEKVIAVREVIQPALYDAGVRSLLNGRFEGDEAFVAWTTLQSQAPHSYGGFQLASPPYEVQTEKGSVKNTWLGVFIRGTIAEFEVLTRDEKGKPESVSFWGDREACYSVRKPLAQGWSGAAKSQVTEVPCAMIDTVTQMAQMPTSETQGWSNLTAADSQANWILGRQNWSWSRMIAVPMDPEMEGVTASSANLNWTYGFEFDGLLWSAHSGEKVPLISWTFRVRQAFYQSSSSTSGGSDTSWNNGRALRLLKNGASGPVLVWAVNPEYGRVNDAGVFQGAPRNNEQRPVARIPSQLLRSSTEWQTFFPMGDSGTAAKYFSIYGCKFKDGTDCDASTAPSFDYMTVQKLEAGDELAKELGFELAETALHLEFFALTREAPASRSNVAPIKVDEMTFHIQHR